MQKITVEKKSDSLRTANAQETIIKQLITGIACLVPGITTLTILILWANSWGIHYSDNSKQDFWIIGGLYGYLGLVIITASLIHKQFIEALSPKEVVHKSIKYSFWGGIAVLVIFSIPTMILGDLGVFTSQILFVILAFMIIGGIVGMIQGYRLKHNYFDPIHHQKLISNEADVKACKSNILPYRHKVAGFWRAFGFSFLTFLLTASLIFLITAGTQDSFIGIIANLVILGLVIYLTHLQIDFLYTRQLKIVEGKIKKTSYRGSYLVECNQQKFIADSETWHRIKHCQKYLLWYSQRGTVHTGRLVAFECKQL